MKNPLEIIQKNDKDLFEAVMANGKMAYADGALGRKEKLLMAMAIDATHGAADGVHSLAMQAKDAGATTAQIMEAVRVAFAVSGTGALFTAARGLDGVL